jgi:hypothetical protein
MTRGVWQVVCHAERHEVSNFNVLVPVAHDRQCILTIDYIMQLFLTSLFYLVYGSTALLDLGREFGFLIYTQLVELLG